MADYIDRQAAIDALIAQVNSDDAYGYVDGYTICLTLATLPSVDVVEVVRCKDCIHRYFDEDFGLICDLDSYDPYEANRHADNDNWYCADGKPK